MRLDVNVVTSLVGAGLEREYLLLKDLLNSHDIYVNGMHYTNLGAAMVRSDITIFFEVVMPQALSLSRENWLFPNSEWWNPLNDRFLPQFTRILCKTKDCYDIWCQKVGSAKCVYTSFEARDIYRPEIPREVKFLHVAGKSEHKNTDAVLRAWRMARLPHINPLLPLTVVARAPVFDEHFKEDTPFPDNNVTYIPRATDDEIIHLMNSHQIHMIPSMYEGFGHVIHEALGCGGLVITTNAAPMNSYDGVVKEFLIPACKQTLRSLAQLHEVSPATVNDAARKAMHMAWSQPEIASEHSRKAREAFLANREFFRTTFMKVVNGR